MLPPVTRRCGAGAQGVPVRELTSRAMDAKRSIYAAARSAGGQVRQPLALAAQEGSEAESVVQLRQRRHVRQAAPEAGSCDLEPENASDAREPAREVHRLAMLAQALP